MRLATYEHLIAAEDLADTDAGRLHVAERRDLDLDGHDDVRLAGEGQVVTLDLTDGAGIGGWDIRPVRHALTAVMRRRPEAYHQTLREHDAKAAGHPDAPGDELVSIHELVLTKEPGLAARLHYDPYERRSGLVRFLEPGTTPAAWANGEAVELGDAVEGIYRLSSLELDRATMVRDAAVAAGHDRPAIVQVTKDLVLGGDRAAPTLALTVTVENRSDQLVTAILGDRMEPDAARRGRQSGGLARGRWRARRPRRPGRRRGGDDARPGQRLRRRRDRDDRLGTGRSVVGPDRDHLELGGRLRARLPGGRPAPLLAAQPGRRRVALVHDRSRGLDDP